MVYRLIKLVIYITLFMAVAGFLASIGAASENLTSCRTGAEFIGLVAEGRSPVPKSDFEKLVVRFVKSDFGKQFSALSHFQSYLEMCVYFEGSEQKMAEFLRSLLKEVQT